MLAERGLLVKQMFDLLFIPTNFFFNHTIITLFSYSYINSHYKLACVFEYFFLKTNEEVA